MGPRALGLGRPGGRDAWPPGPPHRHEIGCHAKRANFNGRDNFIQADGIPYGCCRPGVARGDSLSARGRVSEVEGRRRAGPPDPSPSGAPRAPPAEDEPPARSRIDRRGRIDTPGRLY